jgi:hypothetical protein
VRYNAFGYVPTTKALLKDFIVEMLDDDLDEYELRMYEYAKDKNGFLPGLSRVMPMIREVYGAKHFNLKVLPLNPYRAYTLFVLNHPGKITRGVSPEELFGILSVHRSQFEEIFVLAGRRQVGSE